MSFQKAWIIAQKEFSMIRLKRSLMYSYVILPLLLAIGLPFLVQYLATKNGALPALVIIAFINSFQFFFVILALLLCSITASYSIVGEKIQKSLEPLLSTPATDGEILLGKTLSAFIPSILAIFVGSAIYVALVDKLTYPMLGYFYYPNWSLAIVLLILTPLAMVFSVEVSTMSSSRVTDARGAYQISLVGFAPFFIIYVLSEVQVISLTNTNLLIICSILAAVNVLMYFAVMKTFNRDKILTSWK